MNHSWSAEFVGGQGRGLHGLFCHGGEDGLRVCLV